MVLMMSITCFACTANDKAVTGNQSNSVGSGYVKQKINLLKAEHGLTAEDLITQIKSEYLIQNNGYKDSDEVVVILTLNEPSVIESFNETDNNSYSANEYAKTPAGQSLVRRIKEQQKGVINSLSSAGLISEVIYSYSTITNGLAVRTTYGNVEKLEKRNDLKSVILSDTYNRPQSVESDTSSIVNVVDVYETGIFKPTGVDLTGKGTSVAVLDSGFDCSHEVFNTIELTDEASLMFTRNDIQEQLVEGDLNASTTTKGLELKDVFYSNKIPFVYDYADKDPDVFPYDSAHGTHVAGIIGGYSENDQEFVDIKDISETVFHGIAPETQLVLLKVFPDLKAGAVTEDILAALEDAVKLEVDAINMSLGSSCGFAREEDYDRVNNVYESIRQSGINLVTAASNDHSSGMGGELGNTNKVTNPDSATVGSPSTYEAALSVASISGVKSKYLVANGSHVMFFKESSNIAGKENNFFTEIYEDLKKDKSETITLKYVTIPGIGAKANYASFDKDYLKGKIFLIRRGETTFEEKALIAKNYGAAAVIIYNNIEGEISMSMGKSDHVPTVSISKEDGELLAEKAEGELTFKFTNEAGPFMSDFSSWGPTPDLGLKPEITGHGGRIISAVPGGGYDEQSGTSMACPNVCGVTVLIKQFLKEKYQDQLNAHEYKVLTNQLMMSTATIAVNDEGNPYSPRKQGAGLASLLNSVTTKAYITVDGSEKSKLELGDDKEKTGVYTMNFNLVNLSNETLTYDLSVIGLTESVSTSDDEFVAERSYILNGSTEFTVAEGGTKNGNKVTLNASSTAKISVTYTLNSEDKKYISDSFPYGMYVEGFVKLVAEEGEVNLNVPFLAFYGDWTEAPMFDKTLYEVDPDDKNGAINEEDKLKADYYATTPLGSYFHNYIIPLGAYVYAVDESKYDQPAAKIEHIAMSDELDTINGIYGVYAGLLRGAKTMTFTIKNKVTGEIVYEHIDYNAYKAHYSGGVFPYIEALELKVAEEGWENNAVYEFSMTGLLDYGDGGATTNARNTFSFDFTVDTEAPVIKEAFYEKEYDKTEKRDRYYITLTVYDNHYIQSIQPVSFKYDAEENQNQYSFLSDYGTPVDADKGTTNTVRFEITDYLKDMKVDEVFSSGLAFHIDDYAMNNSLYLCSLPGSSEFKFTEDGTVDGEDLQVITAKPGEVIDLTKFICSPDDSMGNSKDFLQFIGWNSSNEKVATVNYGTVVCNEKGTALITAYEQVYGNSQVIQIIIGEDEETSGLIGNLADQKITQLRFAYFDTLFAYPYGGTGSDIGETGSRIFVNASPSVSMYPGEKIRLYYETTPWYVNDNYDFIFESTNKNAATVDEKTGEVMALKEGTTTIVLRERNKKTNLRASYTIKIESEFIIENRQLMGYKGFGGDVVIPDDEGIYTISAFAFCLYTTDPEIKVDQNDWDANKIPYENTTITSITIPYGVEYIEKQAFNNLKNLKTVTLLAEDGTPATKTNLSSISFVREKAFMGCESLESINFDSVEAIGYSCFEGCSSLKSISLTKAYSLGKDCFKGCNSLVSIDLTHLRNAGNTIFENCTSLKNVTLGDKTKLSSGMFKNTAIEEITVYAKEQVPSSCFENCKNLRTVNLVNDLELLDSRVFAGCENLETFNCKSILTIGDQAFLDCKGLTTFTLPEGNVTISKNVFSGCTALNTVKFGKTTKIVTALGSAFANSVTTFDVDEDNPYYFAEGSVLYSQDKTQLLFYAPASVGTTVVIPASVTTIGTGAFAGTNVVDVTIEGANTEIGAYAFANCTQLQNVTLANGVKIGDGAFYGAGKTNSFNVTNLDKVGFIGARAFESSKLTGVTISDNAEVGEYAFARSKVVDVNVGANVILGNSAFYNCTALFNLTFGEGAVIGESAFESCISLETPDLSNVKVISKKAFYKCTKLTTANLAQATDVEDYAFAGCKSLITLNIPKVQTIGIGAFAFSEVERVVNYLESVKIYDEKTDREREGEERPTFGKVTPTNAPQIEEVELPNTLTEIGTFAFAYAGKDLVISIPSNLTYVSEFAFVGAGVVQVELSESVETIERYAFAYANDLVSINLENVVYVEEYAFADVNIDDADLSSVEIVKEFAFYNAGIYGELDITNAVSVAESAFESNEIKSIEAEKLEVIGNNAFKNNGITSFAVSETLKAVGSGAFYGCSLFEKFTDKNGNINAKVGNNVIIENGILYVVMETGDYKLTSIPAKANIQNLVVLDGTKKIDAYTANENKNIKTIVLPDGLKTIGNYAFYGCTALEQVEFKSVIAPTLESNGDIERVSEEGVVLPDNQVVLETDPGYGVIHNLFCMSGYEPTYYNFIDLSGKKKPIKMVLPANKDIEGYDGIIYQVYFGKVENAQRSSYVAMEKSMIQFIEYAKKVVEINKVMLTHEEVINNALSYYNAVTQDYRNYGISEEEWTLYATKTVNAKAELKKIILANASTKVKQLQAEIDNLTGEFTIDKFDTLKDLTKRINDLMSEDRAKLDRTNYDAMMLSYNAYVEGLRNEVLPVIKEVANTMAGVEIPVAVATALTLSGLAVAIIKRRWFM